MQHQAQTVPISSIYVSKSDYPKSPPGNWPPSSENQPFADLKASIKKRGLLMPVFVERRGSNYRVVMGQFRFQACVELGWKYVRVVEIPKGMKEKDIGNWYFGTDPPDEAA